MLDFKLVGKILGWNDGLLTFIFRKKIKPKDFTDNRLAR